MVSQVLNTFDRHLVKVGKGFVLLCIVTCLGCPQQPATQNEPIITPIELTHAKETPVKAESELTPEKITPITPEIPPVTPQNARVRELQEERLRVCQELVKGIELVFREELIHTEDAWKARENLLDAQLDLSETTADRVRIHQELVQGLESLHKQAETRFREGVISHTDELWVRSQLLKAKIALEKEKALPN